MKKIARELIHLLDSNRSKHFSFIVERNTIISIGWNQTKKTHPIANRFGYRFNNIHSELHAIANFPYRVRELTNYKLINIRMMSDGTIGYAKPCKTCQIMLASFNISDIYFSNGKGGFSKL